MEAASMSSHIATIPRPPRLVRWLDPVMRRLLSAGLPMGPNILLTVRGRKTGKARSIAVALVEIGDRRWVVSAFGEVEWVRNLRAAGEAEIRMAGQPHHVRADEYSPTEAAAWFRDLLIPYVRSLPLGSRMASSFFAREIIRDPEAAAQRRPVFELTLTS
jgi:deazaflavin-dependent oxidoreductase (nitroreductase family)